MTVAAGLAAATAVVVTGPGSSASVIDTPPPGSSRFLQDNNPAPGTYWAFSHTVTDANGVRTITASVACNYKDPTTNQDVHLRLKYYVPGNVYGTPPAPSVTDTDPRPNPLNLVRRPTVVYFHSGGWYSNDETELDPPTLDKPATGLGDALSAQLSRGWNVISAEYRLSTQAPFPAPVIDAKAAVNCVKRIPTVNRNHVVVAGSSAGGHLATMVALTSSVTQWEPAVASNPDAGSEFYKFDGSTVDLVPGPDATTVKAAVNLDGPNDLRRLHAPLSPYDSALVATHSTLPELFGAGGGRTFANLVPKLLCPTVSSTKQQCIDNVTTSSGGAPWPVDKASPIFYVPAPPVPPAGYATSPPRIYLACGDSSTLKPDSTEPDPPAGFPEGFRRCNDHWAMYDRLSAAYGPNLGSSVQIDTTNDNLRNPGNTTGGDHFTIDTHLDLVALQSFLDGT